MKRWMGFAFAGILGIAAGLAFSQMYYADRIYPGVSAGGVDVGGLGLTQAIQAIEQAGISQTAPQVRVEIGSQSKVVSASSLGWKPDATATAQAALQVGRGLGQVGQRLEAWRNGLSVKVHGTVDAERLEQTLKTLVWSQHQSAKNASVVFDGTRFVVRPESLGRTFDWQQAASDYLSDPQRQELVLLEKTLSPSIGSTALQPAVDEANQLLRPLKLTYSPPNSSPRSLNLGLAEVAKLLKLTPEGPQIDAQALQAVLRRVSRYDQPAQNARYVLRGNQLAIQPEKNGWTVDRDASEQALRSGFLQGQDTIVLPFTTSEATIKTTDLPSPQNLSLIASATSNFSGSPAPRVANVKVASDLLSGYVVPAGEVFSFNRAIGPISLEAGYKDALVISGGRTVEGVGGGVCQVSTTAFRALYEAGLPVVERNPHAYAVRYYGTPGYDAAIYQPVLDLRMTNDTGGPLLIVSKTDLSKRLLTVEVWGIPTGRKVTVTKPQILSVTPAPAPRYQTDPSLPPGTRKQVDWAANGYSTRISRTITDANGSRTETLATRYRPWQAVYLVGPTTHTPETPATVENSSPNLQASR